MTPKEKATEFGNSFKPISGYEDYGVSAEGEVLSFRWNKILKQSIRNGYLCFSVCNSNKKKILATHRILAEIFISNPENKPQVNHINGIKTDNRVDNLEWVTPKENMKHAIDNNLYAPPSKNRKDISIPVSQYSIDGRFVISFPSIMEASRQTGVSQRWIGACVKGGCYRKSGGVNKWVNCKSAGGFFWQQVKEELLKM